VPLYDYRCTSCERVVEVMHGIHDSGPETCESCGGAMRKAISAPAVHFKGSGWAKKDAAASAKKATPKAGSASADPTAAKDKSATEPASEGTTKSTGDSGSEAKTTPTPSSSAGGKAD
jgi:putative FmdB family regulatory protein